MGPLPEGVGGCGLRVGGRWSTVEGSRLKIEEWRMEGWDVLFLQDNDFGGHLEQGPEFRIQGRDLRVLGSGSRIAGFGFRVESCGFRVQGREVRYFQGQNSCGSKLEAFRIRFRPCR